MPIALLLILAGGPAAPPLHAYSWSPVPADCTHITPFVWFRQGDQPEDIAKESLTRPEGHRALFSWDLHREILSHPEDVCRTPDGQPTGYQGVWPEHGIAACAAAFDQFFKAFKAAGGKMDYLILDFEGGYSNWALGGPDKAPHYQAIQHDPRFAKLAERLGFDDLMTVCDWRGKRNYLKWNAVMAGVADEALERGVFEPARRYFPEVQGSNYGSVSMTEDNAVPDLNGHLQWSESDPMGTHQAPSFYTWIGQLGDRTLAGDQPFGRTPFAGLLLTLNTLRAVQRSSDQPVMPWLAWKRYAGDGPGRPPVAVADTPYYEELVWHLTMAGCRTFLFWNPHPWRDDQPPESLSMPKDERLLDGLLGTLAEHLSADVCEALPADPIPWDAEVLATGLRIGEHLVWRVTVQPGTTLVWGKVDGQNVRIEVPEGEVGAWYLTTAEQRLTDLAAGEG